MNKIKGFFNNTSGFILLLVLAGGLIVLFRNFPAPLDTGQQPSPSTQAGQPKSPLPTPTPSPLPPTATPDPPDDVPEPTWTPVIIMPQGPPPTLPPTPLPPAATPVNPNESVLISFEVPASLGEISPNGKLLAFNRTEVQITKESPNPYSQVWLLDLTTMKTTKLVEKGIVGINNSPVWSLDGKRLAYQIISPDVIEVRVIDIDGYNDHPLLKSEDLYGYYWINSQEIGLIRESGIEYVNLEGKVLEKRDALVKRTPSGGKPDVAGSMQNIIVTIEDGALRIILPNGQEELIKTTEGEHIYGFSLAPNSKQVAYIATKDYGVALWISDLQGKDQRLLFERIGENKGRIRLPIWSPDNQSLIFTWDETGTNPNLKLVWTDVKSGVLVPLEVDNLTDSIIFSRDGRTLYYSRSFFQEDKAWNKVTFYQLRLK